MNRLSTSIVIAACVCVSALHAQTSPTVTAEAKQAYNAVKNNILGSAEKMPEENYAFKPTPEIRSFAEVLDHVADSQMRACAAVTGDQKTASASGKAAKAEIISALKDAFAECDKAYDSVTNASSASEVITTPRGQRTRLGALLGITMHDNEQYGIMAVYMRLKGIVPPSSAR